MTTARTDVEGLGVLVIGGTTGVLGRAIAEGLRERGARVAATARSATDEADWPTVAMDVTRPESVSAGFADARTHLPRIDAVINTAGITAQTHIIDTPLDAWNRIIATNLTGAFLVAQEATRVFSAHDPVDGYRGSLVTVASLCAVAGCDYVAAYSASKAGVLGLTRTLASELAPLGIRVNALVPGVIVTPLNRDRLEGTPRGAGVLARTPAERFGRADELVGAAALLVGRGGTFISGTDIVIDGGFLASGISSRGFDRA
jgi:NAD(P)-dependent dehydrogenase (short-subunit alcohol dehydrogenase family)